MIINLNFACTWLKNKIKYWCLKFSFKVILICKSTASKIGSKTKEKFEPRLIHNLDSILWIQKQNNKINFLEILKNLSYFFVFRFIELNSDYILNTPLYFSIGIMSFLPKQLMELKFLHLQRSPSSLHYFFSMHKVKVYLKKKKKSHMKKEEEKYIWIN